MICFFGDDFSVIGGVETTTYNLKKQLDVNYGLKADIFSLNKTMSSAEEFTHLPFNHRVKYLSIIAAFIYLHKKGYTQIITSYFAFNIINIVMSKFLGHKAIIQEHASSKSYAKVKLFLIVLFYRFADKFIVLNKYDEAFYLSKGLNPCILMNCYAYNKSFSEVNSRNYYLVLSRLDDNKRVNLAIESWIIYSKKGGKYPLVVAGDGPCFITLKSIYKNPDIHFIGSINNVHDYLSSARAIIITSRLECLPTVVIEGKYVGTPSIAFNVPSGLKDIINSNVDGILVPDGRCDLIADSLLVLESDERLSIMASNAFESANEFDADKSAEAYYKLFCESK